MLDGYIERKSTSNNNNNFIIDLNTHLHTHTHAYTNPIQITEKNDKINISKTPNRHRRTQIANLFCVSFSFSISTNL